MKGILKKMLSAAVAAVMVFALCITSFAASDFSVEDAYAECSELYPDFVESIKSHGVTDAQIIRFLKSVYEYLLNYEDEITEDNFDSYLIDAVAASFQVRENIAVRNALSSQYSDAFVYASEGKIAPEFMPMYETAKSIFFGNGTQDGDSTEETTAPTEAPTDASTEASTEATTEPTTEASTGTPSDTTNAPSGEEPTIAPTEAATDEEAEVDTDKEENTTAPDETASSAPTENATVAKFTDMGSAAWAEESVYALVGMGIISGYGDGTFHPNQSITRAEFAKIIVMASGRYDANATADFTDVKSSDWYYSYVASAKNLGLVTGRDDGSFDPNANITRADICTIVYRYIRSVNPEFGKDAAEASFSDFAKVPSYAQDAVKALSAAGIVSGMGNNTFEPLSNATRAQSAKIVYGAIKAALQI